MEQEEKMKTSIKNYIEFLKQKLGVAIQMFELAEADVVAESEMPNIFKKSESSVNKLDHRSMNDDELREYCNDYPIEGKIKAKLLYLEGKFPYAWRISDRREVVEILEGKENAKFTMGPQVSSCCQTIKNKTHKALNIGGRKNDTFYGRIEWVDEENMAFKLQYSPLERIMKEFPESKLGERNWK